MKIRREPACQRRHHRVTTPLGIAIDGKRYKALNWSMGGLLVTSWKNHEAKIGDEFKLGFVLPFQQFNIGFNTKIRLVRLENKHRQAAFAFIELSERQQALLSHFLEDLIRGVMSPVDDTILRIDSPVTPVSTEPDPNPLDQLPARRWNLRQLGMAAFYGLFGVLILSYISFTLYANFMSLEVDTGVVSAPIERIVATTDGRIQKIAAPLDKDIEIGKPLIIMEDADIEEQISRAKIRIERDRASLQLRRDELALERDKLFDFQQFLRGDIKSAQAQVTSLSEQLRLTRKNHERLLVLRRDGHITRRELELSLADIARLKGEVQLAVLSRQKQADALDTANQKNRVFTGERFEGKVQELTMEVGNLQQQVSHTTQELLALYQHRDRLSIQAASKGRLVRLLKTVGSSTRRGETIALFERDEQRLVDVYLTQEEVLQIRLEQHARVYFPSLDAVAETRVIAIDRTSSFIDEKQSTYSWRASEERTARVTLAFENLSHSQIRQQFPPGIPAVVVFPQVAAGIFGNVLRSVRSRILSEEPYPNNFMRPNDEALQF